MSKYKGFGSSSFAIAKKTYLCTPQDIADSYRPLYAHPHIVISPKQTAKFGVLTSKEHKIY